MNDLPPRPSNIIRKSSYGRTELFLPSENEILREVKCMGGINRYDSANVYHLLPEAYKNISPSNPLCCWHCCEHMTDKKKIVPLPRNYDATKNVYHVYGATCSPGCAKAYILEHTTFDRGQHLNVLTKMLRDVYNMSDPISETPPRPALKRFGGVFDPNETRRPVECRIVEPPFVSYCMLAEENNRNNVLTDLPRQNACRVDVEEADTFDAPHPPAFFDTYLASNGFPPSASGAHSKKTVTSRKRPEAPASKGPMSKFVKT